MHGHKHIHAHMSQCCIWFVLSVPCVTFTVVTAIKVYQMPLVTWTVRNQQEWLIHFLTSPLGGKIHFSNPFLNTGPSKLSKAYLENKSKRETEKYKSIYWFYFSPRLREWSFVWLCMLLCEKPSGHVPLWTNLGN